MPLNFSVNGSVGDGGKRVCSLLSIGLVKDHFGEGWKGCNEISAFFWLYTVSTMKGWFNRGVLVSRYM